MITGLEDLNLIELFSVLLMGAALVLGLLRLLLGPSTADRIVAADTLSIIVTSGIVGIAALLANPLHLDVALLYVTLAFVGVIAIARAIDSQLADSQLEQKQREENH